MSVNGRYYPLWEGLVERKAEFIGGILQDIVDQTEYYETEIKDLDLQPNGNDSAFFMVVGKDFTCGFDCKHGGIIPGEDGWLTFEGYGGHIWRIRSPAQG